MANTIRIKRGVGKPDSLLDGELAIDTSTGSLYSLVGGVVTELNEPPEGVDLSNYIDSTKRNDVVEGTFQMLWDDSADPTYPFNGRIGYNKNVPDPNALDGSFLYVNGTRGTFSIGRDGDLELHGESEIQGIPSREGGRPWITGFSYVQAADFLDEDGNSIIGAVPEDHVHAPNIKLRSNMNRDGGIEASLNGGQLNAKLLLHAGEFEHGNPPTNGTPYLYMTNTDREGRTSNLGDPKNQWGNAYFDGAVQAADFLDADGNSIVGGGGGGGDDPRITDTQISNWDTSYGWGNHASRGYLTSSNLSGYATETWVGENYQTKGSYAAGDHNHSGVYQPAGSYAAANHTHSEYAAKSHNHDGTYQPAGSYAASNHNHNGVYQPAGSYATANHTHTEYAATSHTHSEYAAKSHTHDYSASNHNHSGVYQPAGSYAAASHTHSEYAAKSHTHDYAASNHNHSGVYQPAGSYAAANHNHSGVYAPASHSHSYVPLSGNSTISGTLTATDFVATSDMALKMNVERAETGLIDLIDGVTFDWKDSGKAGAGVLAQQIEKVLPDLVHTSDDGTKTVSYLGLLAYMIEEIKALKHGR